MRAAGGTVTVKPSRVDAFTEFVKELGGRLQQALMAALGADAGSEATSEALAYAWEHWDRVQGMANPAGYLYRVGRSRGRRFLSKHPVFPEVYQATDSSPWVEPALPYALRKLSERQRLATVLVHGAGWTFAEVAELLDVDRGTVNKHAERGLAKLRAELEVEVDV